MAMEPGLVLERDE